MRLLITGAAGFVATNLIPMLCKKFDEVIGVDSFDNLLYSADVKKRNIDNSRKYNNFIFFEQNLAQGKLPQKFLSVDVIINFAALPGQLKSWNNLSQYTESNLGVVTNMLSQLDLSSPIVWIQASTSSVYGSIAVTNENSRCEPSNPYGTTKLAAENLLINYGQNFNLNYVILRFFSLYGPYQRPDMGIHKFLNAIHKGDPITIYGDGKQTRGFTYVGDACQITLNSIPNSAAYKQIFNVSGGVEISANEIVQVCERVVGKKANIVYVKRPIGDQMHTNGFSKKTQSILEFLPNTSLLDGIEAQWNVLKSLED
jgi:UDP-glucuronate 4-epimerase